MAKKENPTKSIYVKSLNQWVPVSDEFYSRHFKEINAFRVKMTRRHLCFCPRKKWWLCDMVCSDCEFYRDDKMLSLDHAAETASDDANALSEKVPDPAMPLDERCCEKAAAGQLMARLKVLMPEAEQIGQLRQMGYTDEVIADKIGIPRTTFLSRIEAAKKKLANEVNECLK